MSKRDFWLLLVGFILAGCMGSFPYRYYGMDCGECQGRLLAAKPKDDIPMTVCKPDDAVKGKCIVMMIDEYWRFREDYDDKVERLKACEQMLASKP